MDGRTPTTTEIIQMNKPLLLVVTGTPASGKTTLAHMLAGKINCPLISRDELKEGLVNTLNLAHTQLEKSVDMHVYDTFFETINLLISKQISIIAEAAFQHKLWKPKLLELSGRADIKIIICSCSIDLVKNRFANRLLHNADRERYHGDQSVAASKEQVDALIENYQPIQMNVPTLQVDTSDNYNPGIDAIISFIKGKQSLL